MIIPTVHSRSRGLRSIFQSFKSLLQRPSRVPLLFRKGSFRHGIAASRDIVTVDVKRDQGLDVELLLANSVFVRVLVEAHGDQLNDNLLSARNERNDEEPKDETLKDVEIRV